MILVRFLFSRITDFGSNEGWKRIGGFVRIFTNYQSPRSLADRAPSTSMIRMLVHGSSTATIVGLSCAAVGGFLCGLGALGFCLGSCVGFCMSVSWFYRSNLRRALLALDAYPSLMQMHLVYNHPLYGF